MHYFHAVFMRSQQNKWGTSNTTNSCSDTFQSLAVESLMRDKTVPAGRVTRQRLTATLSRPSYMTPVTVDTNSTPN